MEIKGKCHCESFRFDLLWPIEVRGVARRCSCGFCTAFGAAWISNPDATLELPKDYMEKIKIYRFGHETADFCFCKICGVLCVATCHVAGRTRSVVNVSSLEYPNGFFKKLVRTDFSKESESQRFARRERNWSPVHVL